MRIFCYSRTISEIIWLFSEIRHWLPFEYFIILVALYLSIPYANHCLKKYFQKWSNFSVQGVFMANLDFVYLVTLEYTLCNFLVLELIHLWVYQFSLLYNNCKLISVMYLLCIGTSHAMHEKRWCLSFYPIFFIQTTSFQIDAPNSMHLIDYLFWF